MRETSKLPDKDEKVTSREDYESLLEKYQFSARELSPGKIIRGKVIKITQSHILVDIGFKSEGAIPLEEFANNKTPVDIRLGDDIEAILEKTDMKNGYLLLSKKNADTLRALDHLEKAYSHKSWITGKITEKTKNGYTVDVGIPAFLPDSHADIRAVKNPEKLLGGSFKFAVIKFDRRTENAVLSRKFFLQDEREKKKRRVFASLARGQKIKGQVKSLTNFGAFIDIGGVEGLLHISDISWGKISHPSELFQVGQEVEVIVLDFNEKDEKISLGYKQLTPDPWENIEEKYKAGEKVRGKVVSLTDFGAFVELEEGVEGLIHISDLTWSRKLVHPKKVLEPGEEVTVTILDVNPSSKRISLGLKQSTPHPLKLLKQKYTPGSRIKGMVTSITDFGAFVEVEKGIEGLVHISDISWEKIKHPSQKLKVGEEAEVIILNIDIDKQKISLGLKQLQKDIWEDFFARHKTRDLIKVKIVRITDFGVFVEITPGIEGVVFLSELDEKKVESPAAVFSVGEERTAKILKMDPKEKKISLSFKQAQFELQKLEYQKYREEKGSRLTLGDIMGEQLLNIASPKKKISKKKEEK